MDVGKDENHPLGSLMDVLGVLIEKYEDEHSVKECSSHGAATFGFYLGNPISSIPALKLRRCPSSVAAPLAALPSISVIPFLDS
jgi:hypothetical protein